MASCDSRRSSSVSSKESDGVTAHFADGSRASADVLVGADASHSRVRAQSYGVDVEDCSSERLREIVLARIRHWSPIVHSLVEESSLQRAVQGVRPFPF
jgi:2-polyprenyl-6-methoxyphenol hydroxylase-like FAD-dependent oxidoreductase